MDHPFNDANWTRMVPDAPADAAPIAAATREAPSTPRFDEDGAWREPYRAARASTKALEDFASFRARHPPLTVSSRAQTWRYRIGGRAGGPLMVIQPDRHAPAEAAWRLFESFMPLGRVALLEHAAGAGGEDPRHGATAVIEAETHAPAILVGVGAGALPVQRLADRRPDLVAGLMLLNGAAPMSRYAGRLRRRARLLRRLPPAWAARLQRRAFQRILACPTDEVGFWRGFQEEALGAYPPALNADVLLQTAALHQIGGDSPSSVRAPVVLFQSEGETVEPQPAQRRLAARYPQAERICFSCSAGHTLEITRPNEIARMARRLLLQGVGPASAQGSIGHVSHR